jgi:hypothetical protein
MTLHRDGVRLVESEKKDGSSLEKEGGLGGLTKASRARRKVLEIKRVNLGREREIYGRGGSAGVATE